MGKRLTEFEQKRMEASLSAIGAKIAEATELARKAQELAANSEQLLIIAQQEIEELYILLGQEV